MSGSILPTIQLLPAEQLRTASEPCGLSGNRLQRVRTSLLIDRIPMRSRIGWWMLCLLLIQMSLSSRELRSQESPVTAIPSEASPPGFSAEDIAFFESKVRPLLIEHCHECHGPEKHKGGLRLDSREAVLAGGNSGPAIDLREKAGSTLLSAIRWESFEMPPGGKLPDGKIAILEEWVQRGAPWPGGGAGEVVIRDRGADFTAEDRAWWAVQPLADPPVPELPDDSWSRNGIDRFILQRLRAEGIEPAPEADRATLIRRLSFDLLGLPPTPGEVASFEDDPRPDAWERLVEQMLSNPHYGERQARLWLDVVRYAESDGYRTDHYRPNAWRYRDYVINAFNADKPYDRFVQEQLAGDELFPDDPDALVATGYLRHWIYEYNNRDAFGQWETILNELTDTTGDVFLGVGMQCARCHDHKFDPILQTDYYRLQAWFAGLLPDDHRVIAPAAEQAAYASQLQTWEDSTAAIRARIAAVEAPYRDRVRREAISKFPPDVQRLLTADSETLSPLETQVRHLAWRQIDYEYDNLDSRLTGDDKERVLAARRELLPFDSLRPEPLPAAMVMTDVGPVAPATVIPKKRTIVAPGVLSVLNPADAEIPPSPAGKTTGRRAALARWLTEPGNPLSTRVIVNRVWQGHFGTGLATNANDFGLLGGPPSHPELLDWLTRQFLRGGWSLKNLHRLIVLSAAYRQSAEHPRSAEFQLKDPANRLHWRRTVRRLEAEQIRDALLLVSGRLDRTSGGPGVASDVPRRSVYVRVMRNERDPLLECFDLPYFFTSTAARDTTTTPLQSLLMFNSQIMLNHAAALAADLRSVSHDESDLIRVLWQRVFGRHPRTEELDDAVAFLARQRDIVSTGLPDRTQSALPVNRLPYRDGQAIVVAAGEPPPRIAAASAGDLNVNQFTVEVCFQLRSIHNSGAVRTLAARWNGDRSVPGWSFGITGAGSRRKPQTLVLQLFGTTPDAALAEAALFSDQTIRLNTPYYASVSVIPATSTSPGRAVFRLKDLSNDDEPLSTVTVDHVVTGGLENDLPLTIGGRSGSDVHGFDGMLDDVRLSASALNEHELLLVSEASRPDLLGFWRFEPVPGLLEDSSRHSRRLMLSAAGQPVPDPSEAALADLCHVLLNSSEFLYVQ